MLQTVCAGGGSKRRPDAWADPGLVRIMGWKSLLYSVVKNTGYVVAGLCSVAVGLLYVFQDKLLYHPVLPGMERSNRHNPRGMKSPREHGIAFEDLRIETEDGLKIHAWLMRPAAGQEARATVLYFHGNAGNIGFRLPNAKQMVEILRVNVLLVEYRGYGDSDDARPSETGFMRDARAALKQMLSREDIDPARIITFGRSIGGAVALSLAHDSGPGRGGIAAVIVENTFLSIGKMVDTIFPALVPLKPLVLRLRWNSEAIIDRVEQPILFINGARDELVPPSHSHQLHKQAAAARFKELYIIPNGSHNDTWQKGGRAYYAKLDSFIQKCFGEDAGMSQDFSTSGAQRIPIMPRSTAGLAASALQ